MTTNTSSEIAPTLDSAGTVEIDVARLFKTKLLAAATSGAGKSWALRRILERIYGHAPQFVYDPEGEYHTLREAFSYVLVGPGGEIAASVETAAEVTLKLLEVGVSVVFDLSDLGDQREVYIERSINALMNAPRKLWRPVVVAIDEIHKFAPERGAGVASSTGAIKSLATAGRKRPYILIAATQRVAELVG